MPWRPGERPVEKVDQETGVCDGMVERSGEKVPWARSFARLGSLPSSIHFSVSLASTPSKPRITSFCPEVAAAAGRASGARAARTTKTSDSRRYLEMGGGMAGGL